MGNRHKTKDKVRIQTGKGDSPQGRKDGVKKVAGPMRSVWKPLAAICALVIGVYAYTARRAGWNR